MSNDPFLFTNWINGELVRTPLEGEILVENILHTNPALLQAVSRASTSMDSVMTETERLIKQYDSLLWDGSAELPSEAKRQLGVLLLLARHCAERVFKLIAEIEKMPPEPR